ncbi:hypothetical protein PUNSTDRAFT_118719 [Punctularia strigosozonata HHB-11173 SS5]|uniref:uncharacterized protein n=1 Tax=Punctularia strigosozonata (strain HHB-11173) TaxID=741275 RepID=UPI00044165AF|nr:uncharacterized protein PUNSTDRAFT_118719 [Punctularia strigosozonata HHB-11173 SS5]EIN11214.1 hypothetical protein PUNSTDRAFT_118719 [Punctularia strigosozonata HHB-11173 SS5]
MFRGFNEYIYTSFTGANHSVLSRQTDTYRPDFSIGPSTNPWRSDASATPDPWASNYPE